MTVEKKFRVKITTANLAGISAEIVVPEGACPKTILYLHGGGYFMGSLATCRENAARLANICQAQVITIDYRLAPEHPFPAALEDTVGAYQNLLAHHAPSTLLIAGDSAGGGLALAAGLFLRDQKIPLPLGFICISPWTDLTGSGASIATNAMKDVWLSKKHIDTWAPWYCKEHEAKNPYISPAFGDYEGFPPILLLVGDQEVLKDDSTRVHIASTRSGVNTTLYLGRGMQHNWMLGMPWLEASVHAFTVIGNFAKTL
jgi:acetyl esterase/lipase